MLSNSRFIFILKNLLLTVVSSAAALCHSEATSLANLYLSEATGLVGVHCPEVTRPVEMSEYHFICKGPVCRFCGSDSRGEAWDTAIVVDREVEIRLECPGCYNSDCGGLACPCAARDRRLLHDQEDLPEHNHRSKQLEGRQRVWRKPRQPNSPPLSMASSSTSQLPVQRIKLEPVVDVAQTDGDGDGNGHASEITALVIGESQASIFGPCSALHEVEEADDSEVSSRDDDERSVCGKNTMPVVKMDRVTAWRTKNFLQHDLDFAYVFEDFEQAYSHAGRAVAVAWSRARLWVEPEMVTSRARISASEATATEVRKVDEENMKAAGKKKVAKAPFLRQPGKGTEPEKTEEGKVRFIEPLAQLMMDCRVGHFDNASATDEEIMSAMKREATHVVEASDIPTLHRAVTTADEVRKYFEYRAAHMGMDYVEPILLEEFFWQSSVRTRAVNSIAWMCDNLQLGWPIDKVKKPDVGEVSFVGMKSKQAPAAQPGMLKALENAMEAAAENDDPTWLALLASWLQAMAKLRLVHLLRRSAPVKLYDGWMLFFCKQGKQKHDCAGFCWGVPSRTSSGYMWTQKFLTKYNQRRQSDVGKKMMGMIFRTDTREYLSSKAVNVSTINAVAGVVQNPYLLATYSWKRMLPTIALPQLLTG